MKIAVLGSGNAGHIFAADLSLAGHEVHWCKLGCNNNESWDVIKQHGTIELQGVSMTSKREGTAKVALMTDDVQAAVQDVSHILVVTTANRHAEYISALLKCDLAGKTIIFMPGKNACLYFQNELNKLKIQRNFYLGETSCFPYANRIISPGVVSGYACKSKLPFSAFPAQDTAKVLDSIAAICPIAIPTKNVLVTSTIDHCNIMHPIAIINNLLTITSATQETKIPYYGYNEKIGSFADKLDEVKLMILAKLGSKSYTIPDILKLFYGAEGKNSHECIKNVSCYGMFSLPKTLDTRYITEDVPFGLVPMFHLATLLNIDATHIKTVIERAGHLSNVDYLKTGYTLENLGIANLSLQQLTDYLQTGELICDEDCESTESYSP